MLIECYTQEWFAIAAGLDLKRAIDVAQLARVNTPQQLQNICMNCKKTGTETNPVDDYIDRDFEGAKNPKIRLCAKCATRMMKKFGMDLGKVIHTAVQPQKIQQQTKPSTQTVHHTLSDNAAAAVGLQDRLSTVRALQKLGQYQKMKNNFSVAQPSKEACQMCGMAQNVKQYHPASGTDAEIHHLCPKCANYQKYVVGTALREETDPIRESSLEYPDPDHAQIQKSVLKDAQKKTKKMDEVALKAALPGSSVARAMEEIERQYA